MSILQQALMEKGYEPPSHAKSLKRKVRELEERIAKLEAALNGK